MRTLILSIVLLIWMVLSVGLALSFIGLILCMCDDTWNDIGKAITSKIVESVKN